MSEMSPDVRTVSSARNRAGSRLEGKSDSLSVGSDAFGTIHQRLRKMTARPEDFDADQPALPVEVEVYLSTGFDRITRHRARHVEPHLRVDKVDVCGVHAGIELDDH